MPLVQNSIKHIMMVLLLHDIINAIIIVTPCDLFLKSRKMDKYKQTLHLIGSYHPILFKKLKER